MSQYLTHADLLLETIHHQVDLYKVQSLNGVIEHRFITLALSLDPLPDVLVMALALHILSPEQLEQLAPITQQLTTLS
jgi:hypothetical protein